MGMKRSYELPFCYTLGQEARLRCSAGLPAAALAVAFSVGGAFAPAQADPFVATLPVSVSGPTTVLEGTDAVYTFAVTNNTSQSLSVDFALAYVQYVSGDVTDNIEFRSGAPGVPFVFPAGSVQFFSYDIPSRGVPDGTNDFRCL